MFEYLKIWFKTVWLSYLKLYKINVQMFWSCEKFCENFLQNEATNGAVHRVKLMFWTQNVRVGRISYLQRHVLSIHDPF